MSMSDRTTDRIEVPESRRSSRPSTRRTKGSSSPSLFPSDSNPDGPRSGESDWTSGPEGGDRGSSPVKQDRIHRNVRNFYEMVDELRVHGKQFASVEKSIDTTTAMGWAFIGILAIWAQLESDQISERVRKAMPVASAKKLAARPAPNRLRVG